MYQKRQLPRLLKPV